MKSSPGNQPFFTAVAVLGLAILTILGLLAKPASPLPKRDPIASQFPAQPTTQISGSKESPLPEFEPSPIENLLIAPASNAEPPIQETPTTTDRTVATQSWDTFQSNQIPSPNTAIHAVIEVNGGKLPNSGKELVAALQKLGDFIQLPIPFSAVALDSGLRHPRVLITQRPAAFPPIGSSKTQSKGNLTLGSRIYTTPGSLERDSTSRPNFEGRLFLSANMEADNSGKSPRVKTVEFISWNSSRLRFDFGVIEGIGQVPEYKILDGVRCFSCHKNRGPILGIAPWSNSTHNDRIRDISRSLFLTEPQSLTGVRGPKELKPTAPFESDGMLLLNPYAAAVDGGVRLGADLLRDREIFRALNRTAAGRRIFLLLLSAIVEPGGLEEIDRRVLPIINTFQLSRFFNDAMAVQKATPSNRLLDFSPAGSMGKLTSTGTNWGGSEDGLFVYDRLRADGNHGLTGIHVPSNTKAFLKPPLQMPNQASELVSPSLLAQTIGLTGADRQFLTKTLIDVVRIKNNPEINLATLAEHVFAGSHFADVLEGDELPDRDDFKNRFVLGLAEVLRGYDLMGRFLIEDQYTSGPQQAVSKPFKPYREAKDDDQYTSGFQRSRSNRSDKEDVELIPTTACLRCHDVQIPGNSTAFNLIPALAFDPLDKTSREAWIKTADPARKVSVLSRILKRISTDQDMPPEDSAEYELFRVKNLASFEEAKDFLQTELKKATGGPDIKVPK